MEVEDTDIEDDRNMEKAEGLGASLVLISLPAGASMELIKKSTGRGASLELISLPAGASLESSKNWVQTEHLMKYKFPYQVGAMKIQSWASGSVPDIVAPFLTGANLHAGNKKDGGIRPIAVGNISLFFF